MKHIITIIAVVLLSANSFAQNSSLEKDRAKLHSLLKPLTVQRESLDSELQKTNNPDSRDELIDLCYEKNIILDVGHNFISYKCSGILCCR